MICHQRSALRAGNTVFIDRGAVLRPGQNHAGARPAERLVRGGGDDVGMLAGFGVRASATRPENAPYPPQPAAPTESADLPESWKIELRG